MSTSTVGISGYTLQNIVSLAQATLETLRTEHGQVIETDTDIAGALAAEGVDVTAILERLVQASLDARANAAAADERIGDLTQRRDRFRRHEALCRATVLQVMQALELHTYRSAEFGLSLRPGTPRLVIIDPDALPAEYVQIKTVTAPDTTMIRAALQAGGTVTGATLSNGSPVLQVRSK